MDKNFNKAFPLCPNCNSPHRFMEELGQEVKERGLARPEWRALYEVRTGVLVDQDRAILIPIGAAVPGFHIGLDICMDCGTLYAVELARLEGRIDSTSLPKKPQQPPNYKAS